MPPHARPSSPASGPRGILISQRLGMRPRKYSGNAWRTRTVSFAVPSSPAGSRIAAGSPSPSALLVVTVEDGVGGRTAAASVAFSVP
jgi:hypothetical protein